MTNEIKARNLERTFFFVRNVFHLLLRNNLRFLDLMKLPMLVVKHDISQRSWFVYDASSFCSSLSARNGLEKSYCRGFE